MALVWIAFLLIVLIDLVLLIRRHNRRAVAAFLLLFVSALTLAGIQAAGVEIPGIMILLWKALRTLGLSY